MATYQILVKHLDGWTQCLQFPSPTLTGQTLRQYLSVASDLRLITGTLDVADDTLLTAALPSNLFPSVALLPRLRGGKGGFGSLLRGAATKAGQKKTNNFDACRDMSGRRLRHVNAEKKLEEWKAEAEERKLEKLAEDFLRKKAKEIKKGKGKEGEVEKYLEKYRQDAEKCMEAVEESVRESFALYRDGKRKVLPAAGGSVAKRLKLWKGKTKLYESDSEDDDNEEEDAKEKSIVLDEVNGTSHESGPEGTSTAGLAGANADEETSGRLLEQNYSEEVVGVPSDEHAVDGALESCSVEEINWNGDFESSEVGQVSEANSDSDVLLAVETGTTGEAAGGCDNVVSALDSPSSQSDIPETKDQPAVEELAVPEITDNETLVKADGCSKGEPLNFDMFNSAEDLECLGLERLKTELQSRGLKCGGTLKERAARLFLLKTTPVEKLPKKVLAAWSGGK